MLLIPHTRTHPCNKHTKTRAYTLHVSSKILQTHVRPGAAGKLFWEDVSNKLSRWALMHRMSHLNSYHLGYETLTITVLNRSSVFLLSLDLKTVAQIVTTLTTCCGDITEPEHLLQRLLWPAECDSPGKWTPYALDALNYYQKWKLLLLCC